MYQRFTTQRLLIHIHVHFLYNWQKIFRFQTDIQTVSNNNKKISPQQNKGAHSNVVITDVLITPFIFNDETHCLQDKTASLDNKESSDPRVRMIHKYGDCNMAADSGDCVGIALSIFDTRCAVYVTGNMFDYNHDTLIINVSTS